MTERKPPGLSWESWIDKQIREAQERGEFDNLPGAGKPIPGIDRPHDDLWWVKEKLERENVGFTPPAMALRRDVEAAVERIAEQSSEAGVRKIVAEINQRIRDANSKVMSGPASTLVPLDVEAVVRRWRERSA